jgi:L-fuconolactonase
MRLDTHQHFWQYDADQYPWISDQMQTLKRDFLPPDLEPLLKSLQLDGCIAVQARQSLEETRWLLKLADEYPFIKGVVGWVDLRSEDLAHQLQEFSAHPRFVGVRHVLQDESDDQFALLPDFQRGIAQLREFNLAYDLLIYPRQLSAAARLVEKFPEQRFVLDHIAKPGIAEGIMLPWQEDIEWLAQFPNVSCKLSGMVTEAKWQQWQRDDFCAYLDVVFEEFGIERLMIGSDWPVCLVSSEYEPTMNIVIDYMKTYSVAAQASIMGENATRFYRVTP